MKVTDLSEQRGRTARWGFGVTWATDVAAMHKHLLFFCQEINGWMSDVVSLFLRLTLRS